LFVIQILWAEGIEFEKNIALRAIVCTVIELVIASLVRNIQLVALLTGVQVLIVSLVFDYFGRTKKK
jgi:hypothetical protein